MPSSLLTLFHLPDSEAGKEGLRCDCGFVVVFKLPPNLEVMVDFTAEDARVHKGTVMGRHPATIPRLGSGTVNIIAEADV